MRPLLRVYDGLIKLLAVIAAGGVLLIGGLILADVLSRTFTGRSLLATIPVVQVALLWFTVISAPWLVRERGHVAVDSIIRKAPRAVQRAALWAVFAVSIAACLLLAAVSVPLLAESLASNEVVIGGIDVPYWVFVAPMPLGYLLVATEFLRLALRGESPYAEDFVESL